MANYAHLCFGAKVICKGAARAPGHTEALLQELFLAGQESAAVYVPGLSSELTAALAAGRANFPMASLLQGHSSAHCFIMHHLFPVPDLPIESWMDIL